MTKETNEGATPTANTAASTTNTAAQQATTEQGNAGKHSRSRQIGIDYSFTPSRSKKRSRVTP